MNRYEFGNKNEKINRIKTNHNRIAKETSQSTVMTMETTNKSEKEKNFQLNLYFDIINSQFNDKEMNGKVQSRKTDFSLLYSIWPNANGSSFDKCSQYFT